MNRSQAETAVTGSALVVGGIYVYRRLSETDAQVSAAKGLRLKQLAGAGPVLPVGPFVVGWGFTFLVLALLAQVDPRLGGNLAILVATGSILTNGEQLFSNLQGQLGGGSSAKGGVASTPRGATPPKTHAYPGAVVTVPQGFTVAPTTTH